MGETRQDTIARLRLEAAVSIDFSNITHLAADLLDAPAAAILITGDSAPWLLATTGEPIACLSSCGYACRSAVESLTSPAFAPSCSAAARVGSTQARAFALAPIEVEPGVAIGALIVADRRPRRLSKRQTEQMRRLGAMATDAFRLHGATIAQGELIEALDAEKARVEAQRESLLEKQRLLDIACDLAEFGYWTNDYRAGTVTWSRSYRRLLGLPNDATPDRQTLLAQFDAPEQAVIAKVLDRLLQYGEAFDIELPTSARHGERRWLRAKAQAEMQDGVPIRANGCVIDITKQYESRMEVEALASVDHLTGLANRRALETRFALVPPNTTFLLIDADHFKTVNDTEGHLIGDQVLGELATLLRRELRDGDEVGRLGGDEFLVVIRGDASHGERIATRLGAAVRNSALLIERSNPVTVSIGVAEITDEPLEFSEAVRRADLALYEAKRQGRGRSFSYVRRLDSRHERGRRSLDAVTAALDADAFVPFYQPIIDMRTGCSIGFEALARWKVTDGAELTPSDFSEALADSALATRISDTVLRQAAADASRLRAAGLDFGFFSINATERQITEDASFHRLTALLRDRTLRPADFVIELTESMLLSANRESVRERLRTLSNLGALIAFDDFGLGYASLNHLREFRIDLVKIDMSVIQRLDNDPSATAVVSAVVRMAHELGLQVIAEGVETPAATRVLRNLGCDFAQGLHFAAPSAVEEIEARLRAQNVA